MRSPQSHASQPTPNHPKRGCSRRGASLTPSFAGAFQEPPCSPTCTAPHSLATHCSWHIASPPPGDPPPMTSQRSCACKSRGPAGRSPTSRPPRNMPSWSRGGTASPPAHSPWPSPSLRAWKGNSPWWSGPRCRLSGRQQLVAAR